MTPLYMRIALDVIAAALFLLSVLGALTGFWLVAEAYFPERAAIISKWWFVREWWS